MEHRALTSLNLGVEANVRMHFQNWFRGYRQKLLHPDEQNPMEQRISIVALLLNEEDKQVLRRVSDQEPVEMHFANSRVEAWDAMSRLNAPVILYDRDWPNAEWRSTVQAFAASLQRSCVILVSRVADDYLWQELIRCGGYDLLPKPFHADEVRRALRLALSYWRISSTA